MYLVRPPYLLKKLYPKVIWRMDASQKKIYLTFDDGPVPGITSWVLDVLKQQQVSATFFCVGENAEKYPELFQRITDEKHSVGNHTYHHLNGWNTHTNDYLQNIQKCAEAVNSNLFRPPYGRLKKSQISSLKSQYSIIMWDVLSGDYSKTTSPEICLSNVTGAVRNGSIVVFHDSYKAQKNLEYTLPRFIEFAKSNGFEFGVL
ncbi:MAG: polysaccharide deacetylase family protein [Bacteroidetes bacterium]|nr:polysaccharide deacetylase family protein [Bacteroidota bacterium]